MAQMSPEAIRFKIMRNIGRALIARSFLEIVVFSVASFPKNQMKQVLLQGLQRTEASLEPTPWVSGVEGA